MLKNLLSAAAIVLTLTLPAGAQNNAGTEAAVESATDVIQLPTSVPATINVRSSFGATPKLLTVTSDTTFFAGDEAITLAQLRSLAAKGKTGLYVFYVPATKQISRIRIDATISPVKPGIKPQR